MLHSIVKSYHTTYYRRPRTFSHHHSRLSLALWMKLPEEYVSTSRSIPSFTQFSFSPFALYHTVRVKTLDAVYVGIPVLAVTVHRSLLANKVLYSRLNLSNRFFQSSVTKLNLRSDFNMDLICKSQFSQNELRNSKKSISSDTTAETILCHYVIVVPETTHFPNPSFSSIFFFFRITNLEDCN